MDVHQTEKHHDQHYSFAELQQYLRHQPNNYHSEKSRLENFADFQPRLQP